MVQKAPKSKIDAEKPQRKYIMITNAELGFYERSTAAFEKLAGEAKKLRVAVEKCTGRPVPYGQDTPVIEEHPKDSNFDVLAVTSVQVFPFKDGVNMGRMKGMASVVINDQLHLRGLRIMDGENGLYVGYPNDPFYKGEDLRSMYFPITRQLREHIENCVLEKYQEVTK